MSNNTYVFDVDIPDVLLFDLKNGEIDLGGVDGPRILAAATCQNNDISIEMNIHEACQVNNKATNPHAVITSYFACIKQDGEWENYGYLKARPNVNWNSPDWKNDLLEDMKHVADAFAKQVDMNQEEEYEDEYELC